MLYVGQRIGGHRVVRQIGAGGVALASLQPSVAPPPKPLTEDERRLLEEEMGKLNQELTRYRQQLRREPREGKEAKEASKEQSPADDIVRQETEYAQLLRAVTEAQDQRKQLENKRFLAEMNERINVGDGGVGLVIIDPPYKPTRPARGGRGQAAMIGGAVTLIAALGLMLLLALLDDRVYSRDDIERLETLPLLVTVPLPDRALARELKAAARDARGGAGDARGGAGDARGGDSPWAAAKSPAAGPVVTNSELLPDGAPSTTANA